MEQTSKILVLGLGNPILGDDGVGCQVAEVIKMRLADHAKDFLPKHDCQPLIEVDVLSVGGLSLMERMIGYDRVILVDAAESGEHPIGFVSSSMLEQVPNRAQGHLNSSHDTTLQNALLIGRQMGAFLPDKIWVVTIEVQNTFEFSEELSPAVSSAIPQAIENVFTLISNDIPITEPNL